MRNIFQSLRIGGLALTLGIVGAGASMSSAPAPACATPGLGDYLHNSVCAAGAARVMHLTSMTAPQCGEAGREKECNFVIGEAGVVAYMLCARVPTPK
jgi:hypothetical protein